MPQKTSPFIEAKYGWAFGESGWNSGMDENLAKFSYLFNRNIDDIVITLPTIPVEGSAYYLTSEKRVYFVIGGVYYSSPVPKWFEFRLRTTGRIFQFNGVDLVEINYQSLLPSGNTSQYLRGDLSFQNLTKTVVGLGNVDNTSDLNKPISNATQGVIDTKVDKNLVNVVVNTLSELKSINTTSIKFVHRTEYASGLGDGGTFWRYDPTSTATSNDVTIVSPNNGGGRWLLNTNGWINVRSGGVKVDGATDDSARLRAVFAAALSLNLGVEFPAGTCVINSEILINLTGIQSLNLRGAGASQTILKFSGSNGITVTSGAGNWFLDVPNSSGLRISGVCFTTTAVNTGIGLNLNFGSLEGRPSRSVYLNDVEFRGSTGLTQTWATSLALRDTSYFCATNCRWLGANNQTGNGVVISATDATTDPTELHFTDCVSVYGNIWINSGDQVEGIYLTNCSAIANNVAVFCKNTTGESGLHIIGGHYSSVLYNFYSDHMNDVTISTSLLYSLAPTNGTIYQVYINQASRIAINGCVLVGSGVGNETGVLVENSNGFGCIIDGCVFENQRGNAITLAATSSKVNVGRNSYNGITGVPVNDLNTTHGNTIHNEWQTTTIQTLAGGTSATINVAVPAGQLAEKPRQASMMGNSGQSLIGFYQYDTSTITNLVFTLVSLGGGNIPTGSVRLGVKV